MRAGVALGRRRADPFVAEIYRSFQHQDAHELLNYLLNSAADILKSEKAEPFVNEVFEGTLTNETRCLECETVTSRDESFLDLSLDIDQNVSVASCLRSFSRAERLNRTDKFYCDNCGALQEAEKSCVVCGGGGLLRGGVVADTCATT